MIDGHPLLDKIVQMQIEGTAGVAITPEEVRQHGWLPYTTQNKGGNELRNARERVDQLNQDYQAVGLKRRLPLG